MSVTQLVDEYRVRALLAQGIRAADVARTTGNSLRRVEQLAGPTEHQVDPRYGQPIIVQHNPPALQPRCAHGLGCTGQPLDHGRCTRHATETALLTQHGVKTVSAKRRCVADDCDQPSSVRGHCKSHYWKLVHRERAARRPPRTFTCPHDDHPWTAPAGTPGPPRRRCPDHPKTTTTRSPVVPVPPAPEAAVAPTPVADPPAPAPTLDVPAPRHLGGPIRIQLGTAGYIELRADVDVMALSDDDLDWLLGLRAQLIGRQQTA